MAIDLQGVVMALMGICIASLGWALNQLWDLLRELSEKHHAQAQKVAEHYVTKDDFKEQLSHIRDTCDNIWKAIRKEG